MTNKFQFLFVALIIFFGLSHAEADREVRNGGSGIISNDNAVSLYDGTNSLKAQPIQNLESLKQLILSLKSLKLSDLDMLPALQIVTPSEFRKYYTLNDSDVTDYERSAVVQEYISRLKADKNKIVLFALTDYLKNSTFFLPSFFKLSLIDQAVILYHEALWLLPQKLTYDDVLFAEMIFKKAIQNPNDNVIVNQFYENYASLFKIPNLPFIMQIKNNPTIQLNEIISSDFFKCVADLTPNGTYISSAINVELCSNTEKANLYSEQADSNFSLIKHNLLNFLNLNDTRIELMLPLSFNSKESNCKFDSIVQNSQFYTSLNFKCANDQIAILNLY